MNDVIRERAQGFAPGDLVVLFELDATALGHATIERFTSSAWEDGPVVFGGAEFTPVEIEAEGFEWNGKGPLPRPRLRIGNVNRVAQALVLDFSDLLGAKVTRLRTLREFLDAGAAPDPLALFPVEIYHVERKTAQNSLFIEWELSAAMDRQGHMLPGRQVLRDACDDRYRVFDPGIGDFDYTNATCPYVGVASFTAAGVRTTDDQDRCGKRLIDCELRFGKGNPLPTRAFPGVARVR